MARRGKPFLSFSITKGTLQAIKYTSVNNFDDYMFEIIKKVYNILVFVGTIKKEAEKYEKRT